MMVGRGFEAPAVVQQMLDVASFGDKPQYNMAAEVVYPNHALPFRCECS